MISFIIPFANTDNNLYNWKGVDGSMITLSTILSIKNINKTFGHRDIEIILVDNTNSFPNVQIPNLRIIKGLQYKSENELTSEERDRYEISDLSNHTMWASTAFNIGVENSLGEYIVLQHNDIFYHNDLFSSMISELENVEYISVESKKINLSGYVANIDTFNKLLVSPEIGYQDGGYVKTTEFGLSDAYFFMCKKEFFDDYRVDYVYGDTNHGATIKCLLNNKKFIHLGPYYENPNYEKPGGEHIYFWKDVKLLTHLKGGFSEMKFSFKPNNNQHHMDESNNFINNVIQTL